MAQCDNWQTHTVYTKRERKLWQKKNICEQIASLNGINKWIICSLISLVFEIPANNNNNNHLYLNNDFLHF